MPTTLLFIELLLTGIQSLVWIGLVVTWIFGNNMSNILPLDNYSDWITPLTLIIFGFVYLLGIIIDRLADWIFSKKDDELRKKYTKGKSKLEIQSIKYKLSKEKGITKHLDYNRSRTRIVRSGTLNFGISAAIVLLRMIFSGWTTNIAFLIFGISMFFAIGSYYSWKKLTIAQMNTLEGLRKEFIKNKKSK
jgi:hypothetical protein